MLKQKQIHTSFFSHYICVTSKIMIYLLVFLTTTTTTTTPLPLRIIDLNLNFVHLKLVRNPYMCILKLCLLGFT